jgi:hypothetical protein
LVAALLTEPHREIDVFEIGQRLVEARETPRSFPALPA